MKIKETYIVKERVDNHSTIFIKIHYCINSNGSSISYYKEYPNGHIVELDILKALDFLKDY